MTTINIPVLTGKINQEESKKHKITCAFSDQEIKQYFPDEVASKKETLIIEFRKGLDFYKIRDAMVKDYPRAADFPNATGGAVTPPEVFGR